MRKHTREKDFLHQKSQPKIWIIYFWVYLSCGFLVPDLYALKDDIKFQNVSTKLALSQNTIQCILQDRMGFMWVGTREGLHKYDGYKFTVYQHDPFDPTSLSNNDVRSLCEDRSGVLWIGTRGGGLSRFDREKEHFTHVMKDPDNPAGLNHNEVFVIYEDRSGILWIGTRGGGLNRIDQEKKHFRHYVHAADEPTSLSNNSIQAIYEDAGGILWIGTEGGGLNKFNRQTGQFLHYKNNRLDPTSLSHNHVISICEDRSGVLWISTYGGGLNKFDRARDQFKRFNNKPGDATSLSSNYILFSYIDRSGILWIGTNNGLNKFDPEKEQFSYFERDLSGTISFMYDSIRSIFEDRAGIIWVGTYSELNKLNRATERFVHYKVEYDAHMSLGDKDVTALFEDKNGVLWIGTWGGGLDKFSPKGEQFKHYKNSPNDSGSLSSDTVWAICEDSRGILWIGTRNGGLNRFDQKKEQFLCYRHDPDDPKSLSDDDISIIYEDTSGHLWIGTWGGGLNRFNRDKEEFSHYRHNSSDPSSLGNDSVRTIFEDSSGTLWIGTRDGGLNKLDRETETFVSFKNKPNDQTSLSSNSVSVIFEDTSGILWIGTQAGGLNKFNRDLGTFRHYTEKNGLTNNTICGVLEDKHGNLWISTNKGLLKFNPREETFKNYDVRDGLQSNKFNMGAFYKNKKGEMYFGGVNGFNVFDPDNIRDNPHIPPMVLTDFRIFNKSVRPGADSPLEKSISHTTDIILSYKDSVISFEFSALDFTIPEKNQYAYRMEGFHDNWIYGGTNNSATYTNLDPGKYVFRVKGSNNDGIWNQTGTSIAITVSPPPWQTWWAYCLYGLVFLSAISGYIRYKTSTHLEELAHQRKELEQERKYRRIFENAVEGIYQTTPEGKFLKVNPAMAEILGYDSPAEIIDSFQDIQNQLYVNPKDRDRFKREISEKGSIRNFETKLYRKDGRVIDVAINSYPLKDKDNKILFYEGHLEDITLRKQAEDTLKKARDEMEHRVQERTAELKEINKKLSAEILERQKAVDGTRRALQETKAKEQEIAHINQIVQAVNSTLDFDEVANSIMTILKDIFEFDGISILLIDDKQQQLNMNWSYGDVFSTDHIKQFMKMTLPLDSEGSLHNYVIAKNKPLYFTGMTTGTDMPPFDRQIWELLPFKSVLCLPLEIQNRIIGVIDFLRVHEDMRLSEGDIRKIQHYISHLATAINNARLTEETHQVLKEIAHINQVIQTVNSTLDFDEVIDTVMKIIQGIFSFDQIGIFLVNEQQDQLYIAKITRWNEDEIKYLDFPLKEDWSYVCRCFLKKKTYYITPVTEELVAYFSPFDKKLYELNPVKSYLLLPLLVQNQAIGTIVFSDSRQEFNLSEQDIHTVERYVTQIATAINNARLAEETKRALYETRAKEREIAHLNQMIRTVNSTLDFDEVAASVKEALNTIMEFDIIAILLVDEQLQELTIHRIYGDKIQDAHLDHFNKRKYSLEDRNSANSYVIFKNKTLYFTGLNETSQMQSYDRKFWEILPYDSALLMPLKVQNRVIGTINFFRVAKGENLTQTDIQKIEQYVSHLATAINNALLFEALDEAKKVAEEAKKIAEMATQSKSAFLASMSHEIRTPMNAIIGLTDLALKLQVHPKHRDYLEKIKNSAHLLLGLINDILDFSKIEAGKLHLECTPFSLHDIMDSLSDMLASKAAEKGLELLISVHEDVPEILIGDSLRLGQILINLTNNALKFTETGEILVKIVPVEIDTDYVKLKFSITDTGIGIKTEQISRLFDSFTQAEDSTYRKYGGTGLGLNISKRLVELMHGKIWAESEVGKGSTFFLEITLKFQTEDRELQFILPEDLRGKKVLVVDDNRTSCEILQNLLKSFTFEAKTVSSGDQAILELKNAALENPYALVLMDWQIPGIGELHTSSKIKQDTLINHTPIICMVPASNREEVMQKIKDGIDHFLTKPVRRAPLYRTIMQVFDREAEIVEQQLKVSELDTVEKIRGSRILLVEDNAINQQVATEILERAGVIVAVVGNGRKAVEEVAKSDFEAVLMDIQMPVMDGFEATQLIRKNLTSDELPIIAMTAHAMKGDSDKCFEAGMNDYVTKPIDAEQFLTTLAKWIKPAQIKADAHPSKPERPSKTGVSILHTDLSALDIASGLRRLGGNEKLYAKLLQEFSEDFAGTAEEISAAVQKVDLSQAQQLIHTLKGVSGNISATELHDVAEALEMAIKKGNHEKLDNFLTDLRNALKKVLISVQQMVQTMTEPADEETPAAINDEIDLSAVTPLCKKLTELLKKNNPQAEECLGSLKEHINNPRFRDDLAELEDHLVTFDFKSAQKKLLSIIETLGISISEEV
ncbi:two-component regulator propeller domain-containing protein [candidate division CSSED10-310 bacterium]|uniref:histidine kinase n=1 Tax=candidate division CSSED10-310 bacterium TaxID=2855610 RepID=A0ABV6YVU7_UNCC1